MRPPRTQSRRRRSPCRRRMRRPKGSRASATTGPRPTTGSLNIAAPARCASWPAQLFNLTFYKGHQNRLTTVGGEYAGAATSGARQEGHRRRSGGRGPQSQYRHVLRGDLGQFVVQSEGADGHADRAQDRARRHQERATRSSNTARTSARRSPTSRRASTSTPTISKPSGGERHGEVGKKQRQVEAELPTAGGARMAASACAIMC